MQTINNLRKGKHRHMTLATLTLILIISSMFLLSACNAVSEPTKATILPVQITTTQSPAITQPVDSNVKIGSAALPVSDQALTLEGYGSQGALSNENLTVNEMLMYAVQDEYVAHAEYLAIVSKFGSQSPYTNIISAEESHLASLKAVFLASGLDFPADTSADHIIVPSSLLKAAETGVQAEISNIAMYEYFLTYDLPDNVLKVFTALKNGSDSHLLSFQKQVDKLK